MNDPIRSALEDEARRKGFTLTSNVLGPPTAFRGEYGYQLHVSECWVIHPPEHLDNMLIDPFNCIAWGSQLWTSRQILDELSEPETLGHRLRLAGCGAFSKEAEEGYLAHVRIFREIALRRLPSP